MPPPLHEAVKIKALNVRVHIGTLIEGYRSGGVLSKGSTRSKMAPMSAVGGIVGGVLRMLNQNRALLNTTVQCLLRTAAPKRADVFSCGSLEVGPRCGMSVACGRWQLVIDLSFIG